MLRCTLAVGIAEFGCFGLGLDSGYDCSTKWLFRCVHQQAGQLSVKIYKPWLILSYEELFQNKFFQGWIIKLTLSKFVLHVKIHFPFDGLYGQKCTSFFQFGSLAIRLGLILIHWYAPTDSMICVESPCYFEQNLHVIHLHIFEPMP